MAAGSSEIRVLLSSQRPITKYHTVLKLRERSVSLYQFIMFQNVSPLVKSKNRMIRSSSKCGETTDDHRMLWSNLERSS